MKKYLLTLICAALASSAWAQAPTTVPMQKDTVVTVSTIGPSGVLATTPAAAGHCGKGGCCDSCPKTKTVCVSEPSTTVKIKVLYSSGCETKCLPKCKLLGGGKDCASCQANCGRPIQVRSLYKRISKTECPSTKCVPVEMPVCEKARCAPKCATPCGTGAVVTSSQTTAVMTPAAVSVTRPTLGFTAVP